MRIGVLTFYWSQDNYGQLLQAYALQRYLEAAGHEAFLIQYRLDSDFIHKPVWKRIWKVFHPIKLMRFLKAHVEARRVATEQTAHSRHFDIFREKYLKMTPHSYANWADLQNDPPEADCYIVGSDQVWNFGGDDADLNWMRNIVHAYFLDFGNPSIYRMSYAASWSVHSLPAPLKTEIKPLLAKFNYISVREADGIRLCAECGRPDAEWVVDPTMLLDVEQYRQLYRTEDVEPPERPYLFMYMLDTGFDFPLNTVYDWASAHGLDVIYATGNSMLTKRKVAYLTILQWLGYLDHATAVFTNSFHGAVFATLFHRPYGVLPRKGKSAGMNTRLETLFRVAHLPERYIYTPQDMNWLEQPTNPRLDIDRDAFAKKLSSISNSESR